ncbi:hypothetical protein [Variovorax gossypii]
MSTAVGWFRNDLRLHDQPAHELAATGHLSNRLRQRLASCAIRQKACQRLWGTA